MISNRLIRRIVSTAPVFLAMVATTPLYAGHPLSTEDTGTQGRGRSQVEITTEHGYEEEGGARDVSSRNKVGLAHGILQNLDISLGVPYRSVRSEASDGTRTQNDGIGDIGLDVKWRFYENNGLSFALKGGITTPSGDETKSLGTGKATQNINFVSSYELAPWEFHFHIGYVQNRNVLDQRENLSHVSVAAVRSLGEMWKVMAELGTDTNSSKSSSVDPEYFLAGLAFVLRKGMEFDVGVKYGLTPVETDTTWLGGITFKF